MGVATRQSKLDESPLGEDPKSWVLRSDGTTWNKGAQIGMCSEGFAPEEGDTLGCAYDHNSLDFFLNGERLADISISGIRGQITSSQLC